MIKKTCHKFIEIWEKFSNIIVTLIVNLCIVKKYLTANKTFNSKESFQYFYREVIPVPVILIED